MSSSDPAFAARLRARLESRIRAIPDFPAPGVLFRDVTPLLGDPAAFGEALAALTSPFRTAGIGAVAAIESRGFLFGAGVAERLGVPLAPLRKPGKLPGATLTEDYALEYGSASLEIHRDAFPPGTRVLIVDDVLATGGTAAAAARLCRRLGATVVGFSFLLALDSLGGAARIAEPDCTLHTVLRYP